MTVGRIGVRTGVDGASGGRRDALMSPSGAQEQDGSDDCDHQNEASHGDTDGKVTRRYAKLVLFVLRRQNQKTNASHQSFGCISTGKTYLFNDFAIKEACISAIGGVGYVKTTENLDSGRIPGEGRMIDSEICPWAVFIRLPLLSSKIIALVVAQWRLGTPIKKPPLIFNLFRIKCKFVFCFFFIFIYLLASTVA